MAIEIDRGKIKQRLDRLDKAQIREFGYRCAVRALPFLYDGKGFAYWPEFKRTQHLQAVLRCLDFAAGVDKIADRSVRFYAYADDTAAYAAAADAAYAADVAAAAYAAYAADAAAAAAAAYAADAAAAYATYAAHRKLQRQPTKYTNFKQQILADLSALENNRVLVDLPLEEEQEEFCRALVEVGMGYWADVYRQHLENNLDPIAWVKRLQLPKEVLSAGTQAVIDYFTESSDDKKNREFNEIKVIFLGDGGAGKTSLVRKLLDRTFPLPTEDESTIGVDVHDHIFKDTIQKARLWDFGGQLIYHATHQLFLTERALYIIVLDARAEINADYWLQYVKVFGNNAPVLVVLNKWDIHQPQIAQANLKRKFPNIVGFYNISCAQPDQYQLDAFEAKFIELCTDHSSWQRDFSQAWFDIKNELEALDKPYIQLEDYQQLCAEHDLEQAQQKNLLAILKAMGIVLYYPEVAMGKHILDPQWLSNGIYEVLKSERLRAKNGYLQPTDLAVILDTNRYPVAIHQFLLNIAVEYQLCYRQEDVYIFPDVLPVDKPDNVTIPQDLNLIEYRFDFLHRYRFDFLCRSIFSQLLAKFNTKPLISESAQQVSALWQQGIAWSNSQRDTTAVVTCDYNARKLLVQARGDQQQQMFHHIFIQLDLVFEAFEKVEIEGRIPMGTDASGTTYWESYRRLVQLEAEGEKYRSYPGIGQVPIGAVLNIFERQEDRYERIIHEVIEKKTPSTNKPITANMMKSITISTIQIFDFKETFSLLREDLEDERPNLEAAQQTQIEAVLKRVQRLEEALIELETIKNSGLYPKSKAASRIKEFFADLGKVDSKLAQAIKWLDKGTERCQGLVKSYNRIAPMFGLDKLLTD